MERDAKGRFVKKSTTTKKAAKGTTKKPVNKKSCKGKEVYNVNYDSLPAEIKALIEDMEAHGYTCAGAGVIEVGSTCDKVSTDAERDIDKIFKVLSEDAGAPVVGLGACVGKPGDKAIEALQRAKAKLAAKAAEEAPETPIDWSLAVPQWVNDLHEIYEEGSIPETEEDMRDEIAALFFDTAKVIVGYLDYLEAKDAVKNTKCSGKCKCKK